VFLCFIDPRVRKIKMSSPVAPACNICLFGLLKPTVWHANPFQSSLRVEFLLKTDSGYPKDTGVTLPWQPLGLPSTITPIGQLHQSPPSPIPGDQSPWPVDMLDDDENRDTYGQAQVCSKGHQGSSVDRPCQPSFCWIKFWHVRNFFSPGTSDFFLLLCCYAATQLALPSTAGSQTFSFFLSSFVL